MATNGNISHLDCHEKKRYFQKISSLGCDPYSIPDTFFQPLSAATELPILAFNDIYIYLIHNPSPYTGESLKAYKSTEAYRYFVAGWVLDSKIWHLHKKKMFLVKGKVSVLLTQLCKQLLAASITTQGYRLTSSCSVVCQLKG